MAGPEPLAVATNGVRLRVWRWARAPRRREPDPAMDLGREMIAAHGAPTTSSAGPDAAALVVVHGLTNSARGWDVVCRELTDQRDVFAVDLRGHGESEKPERGYAASDYAADLAGAIPALGLERAIVLGHSLGARASARLAADHPELVSRLILVDPPAEHRYPAQVMAAMNGFLASVRATRAGGAEAVRAQNPHWTDEQVAARVEAHQQVSDRVMLDPIERYDPGTIFDDLPRIACPTLFMYGDVAYRGPGGRPGIVAPATAERARAALRDGQLAFVPEAGHMVPWDNCAGFMAPLRAFLRAG